MRSRFPPTQNAGLDLMTNDHGLSLPKPIASFGRDPIRPARSGDPSGVAYGLLPEALFEQIRTSFIAKVRARKVGAVSRTE
jgi:hypothetical protein